MTIAMVYITYMFKKYSNLQQKNFMVYLLFLCCKCKVLTVGYTPL